MDGSRGGLAPEWPGKGKRGSSQPTFTRDRLIQARGDNSAPGERVERPGGALLIGSNRMVSICADAGLSYPYSDTIGSRIQHKVLIFVLIPTNNGSTWDYLHYQCSNHPNSDCTRTTEVVSAILWYGQANHCNQGSPHNGPSTRSISTSSPSHQAVRTKMRVSTKRLGLLCGLLLIYGLSTPQIRARPCGHSKSPSHALR